MIINNTKLSGVKEIQPSVHGDQRGFFFELYHSNNFSKIGKNFTFVQDNISYSEQNVLRGLHFQKQYQQGKLVICLSGHLLDVIVDLNPNSKDASVIE